MGWLGRWFTQYQRLSRGVLCFRGRWGWGGTCGVVVWCAGFGVGVLLGGEDDGRAIDGNFIIFSADGDTILVSEGSFG